MIRHFEAWSAYLAERQTAPFEWGSQDCATFAAGAILALTGRNPLAGFATWKTKKGAQRVIARHGGLAEAVSTLLPEIPAAMAHRGDVGIVEGPDGPFLVVIEGMTLVGPGLEGLERNARSVLLKAWNATA